MLLQHQPIIYLQRVRIQQEQVQCNLLFSTNLTKPPHMSHDLPNVLCRSGECLRHCTMCRLPVINIQNLRYILHLSYTTEYETGCSRTLKSLITILKINPLDRFNRNFLQQLTYNCNPITGQNLHIS